VSAPVRRLGMPIRSPTVAWRRRCAQTMDSTIAGPMDPLSTPEESDIASPLSSAPRCQLESPLCTWDSTNFRLALLSACNSY
jgi:hypothetical protein